MKLKRFLVVDIEATNRNPLNAQILSGHFLYLDLSFNIIDQYSLKSKPQSWDSEAEEASSIHGIKLVDTILYPEFSEAMENLLSWLGKLEPSYFVCHANRKIFGKFSSYDYAVLVSNLLYLGKHYDLYRACPSSHIISTHSLAKYLSLSCDYDLKSLCSFYKYDLSNHHEAEADTYACLHLLKSMLPEVNLEEFFEVENNWRDYEANTNTKEVRTKRSNNKQRSSRSLFL